MKTVKNRASTLIKLLGALPEGELIEPSTQSHHYKFCSEKGSENRRTRKQRKREHQKRLREAKARKDDESIYSRANEQQEDNVLHAQLTQIEHDLRTATGKQLSELRDQAQNLVSKNPDNDDARAVLYLAAGKVADESARWTTITTVTSSPAINASSYPRRALDRFAILRNVG